MINNNERGAALGDILLGLMALILAFSIFIFIASYAMNSAQQRNIMKGMDYAVTAAAAEIDTVKSITGLSEGFNDQGAKIFNNVFLNEPKAISVYLDVFCDNTGIKKEVIEDKFIFVIVNPFSSGIEYSIYSKNGNEKNYLPDPINLEYLINEKIIQESSGQDNTRVIYVNGNIKTNTFRKRPYFIAILTKYETKGLFANNRFTFAGFADGKAER